MWLDCRLFWSAEERRRYERHESDDDDRRRQEQRENEDPFCRRDHMILPVRFHPPWIPSIRATARVSNRVPLDGYCDVPTALAGDSAAAGDVGTRKPPNV